MLPYLIFMTLFSWTTLDRLLRGNLANVDSSSAGKALLSWQILLAAFYGLCLGLFALSVRETPDARFMFSAALKLPVLIIGATLVTLPSLYVFLALFDVSLSFKQVLGGMLAANTIFATVIASLGPIVGFFSLSSQSYPFILLLNVTICGLGGFLGMRLVVKTLAASQPEPDPVIAKASEETKADDQPPSLPNEPMAAPEGQSWKGILGVWMVLYVFVGTQLAWILRPFIGNPESPFVWFRGKSGSFVDAVLRALGEYLSS
ncbi:MAG: hypothetical protein ABF370_08400 [Verrucomicrobiales bacterium]